MSYFKLTVDVVVERHSCLWWSVEAAAQVRLAWWEKDLEKACRYNVEFV